MIAQLRDLLAAENSPVMAKKDDRNRTSPPQRSQPHLLSFAVWQNNFGQLSTERFRHHRHSHDHLQECQGAPAFCMRL
jgi:hypothetical protein